MAEPAPPLLRRALSGPATAASLCGALVGVAARLNGLAVSEPAPLSLPQLAGQMGAGAAAGAAVALPSFLLVAGLFAGRLGLAPPCRERFVRLHAATYAVFLCFALGAVGVRFGPLLTFVVLAAFAGANAAALVLALDRESRTRLLGSTRWLGFLFFVSGVAALVYQVTWQRALFTTFGVNIESVTVVVTLFMFGLGLGSLVGGALSKRYPERLPHLFAAAEVATGVCGMASLPLIRSVGSLTVQLPLSLGALAIFGLLCVPTLMMGATLPILVAHLHTHYRHVGRSVGTLYFANTLGSAAACFLTADVLFVLMGQQAAVLIAAACNLFVAAMGLQYARTAATARPP